MGTRHAVNAEFLQARQTADREEYKLIMDRCISEIEKAHQLQKTWVIFDVPTFVFGKPFYDQQSCIEVLADMLIEKKFNFKVLTNDLPKVHLFITWAKKNKNKKVFQEVPHEMRVVEREPPSTDPKPTHGKRVAFSGALANLEKTYNAMKESGKLSHLKSFQKRN